MVNNIGSNSAFNNVNSTGNVSGPNANSGASASGATNGEPTSASGVSSVKTSWRKMLTAAFAIGAMIASTALMGAGFGALAVGCVIVASCLCGCLALMSDKPGSANGGQQSAPQNLPPSPGNQEPLQNSGGASGASGSQRTGGAAGTGGTTVAENISPSGNSAAADYTAMEKKLNAACQAYTKCINENTNGKENLQKELNSVEEEIKKLRTEINDSFTPEQIEEYKRKNVSVASLSKYEFPEGNPQAKSTDKNVGELLEKLKDANEKKGKLQSKIENFKPDDAALKKNKENFGKLLDSLCGMSSHDRAAALKNYTQQDFEKLHTLIKEGNYDNESQYLEKLDQNIIMNSNAEIGDKSKAQKLRKAATNVLMNHCSKSSGNKFTSLFKSNNAKFNELTTTDKPKLSEDEFKEAGNLSEAINRELTQNKGELIKDVRKELGDAAKDMTDQQIEDSLNLLHTKLQNAINRTLTSGDETKPEAPETKPPETETKPEAPETKPPESETKPEAPETKPTGGSRLKKPDNLSDAAWGEIEKSGLLRAKDGSFVCTADNIDLNKFSPQDLQILFNNYGQQFRSISLSCYSQQLESLDLSHCKNLQGLSYSGTAKITGIENCRQLKLVHVNNCPNLGAAFLSGLPDNLAQLYCPGFSLFQNKDGNINADLLHSFLTNHKHCKIYSMSTDKGHITKEIWNKAKESGFTFVMMGTYGVTIIPVQAKPTSTQTPRPSTSAKPGSTSTAAKPKTTAGAKPTSAKMKPSTGAGSNGAKVNPQARPKHRAVLKPTPTATKPSTGAGGNGAKVKPSQSGPASSSGEPKTIEDVVAAKIEEANGQPITLNKDILGEYKADVDTLSKLMKQYPGQIDAIDLTGTTINLSKDEIETLLISNDGLTIKLPASVNPKEILGIAKEENSYTILNSFSVPGSTVNADYKITVSDDGSISCSLDTPTVTKTGIDAILDSIEKQYKDNGSKPITLDKNFIGENTLSFEDLKKLVENSKGKIGTIDFTNFGLSLSMINIEDLIDINPDLSLKFDAKDANELFGFTDTERKCDIETNPKSEKGELLKRTYHFEIDTNEIITCAVSEGIDIDY